MSDAELQKVDAAVDALLEAHDPKAEGYEEFRGHQFDAGLAWVMYPEGHGGLGVRPPLQRQHPHAFLGQRLAERRVLGEETVTRVHSLGARVEAGLHDAIDAQVGLGRRRRTDAPSWARRESTTFVSSA